jgi:hypothetical protein
MEEKNMCSRSSIYSTVATTLGDVKGKVAVGIDYNVTYTASEILDLVSIAVANALLANDEKVNVQAFASRMKAATENAKSTGVYYKGTATKIEKVGA